jgi:predicted Holliday junction resolvase-like endonuclease
MVQGVKNIFPVMLPCVILLVYVFIFSLVIIGLIRLVKFLGTSANEQKRIRMELSKVAEEVQRMRQRLEGEERKEELGEPQAGQ